MFAQIKYPEELLPEELDKYLARGWFRMRQSIFTTNFLHFSQQFYSAIWLRVALPELVHDKKFTSLLKQNKKFRLEIKNNAVTGITKAHESLFQLYRQSVSFDVSTSLHELLIGNHPHNKFNTAEVNIYDGDTLIAAGFFDLGKRSAAGITSIYHPAYKKYSLGKYLMYLKMDFCKQNNLQYFYPGYVVPGYAPFDYKLEIGTSSLQYLQLSTQRWVPYTSLPETPDPLIEMHDQLALLHRHLLSINLQSAILYYKFFEANLDPYYNGNGLFDFPVFLVRFPVPDMSYFHLVIYDVRDCKYHLLQCISLINIGFHQEESSIFDADLLKVDAELFATPYPEVMKDHMQRLSGNS